MFMGGVLEFLFSPLRDRLYDRYFKKREKEKEICREAVERIKKERGNFEHIVAAIGYQSDAHRRAVQESSFELLLISMQKLEKVRKFCTSAQSLASRIRNKDASAVLQEINKLQPKLEKFADI